MLFWSELVEGGVARRQQVFLNAGIIARRKDGSKQGSIPIHTHAPNYFSPQGRSLNICVSKNHSAFGGLRNLRIGFHPLFTLSSLASSSISTSLVTS